MSDSNTPPLWLQVPEPHDLVKRYRSLRPALRGLPGLLQEQQLKLEARHRRHSRPRDPAREDSLRPHRGDPPRRGRAGAARAGRGRLRRDRPAGVQAGEREEARRLAFAARARGLRDPSRAQVCHRHRQHGQADLRTPGGSGARLQPDQAGKKVETVEPKKTGRKPKIPKKSTALVPTAPQP